MTPRRPDVAPQPAQVAASEPLITLEEIVETPECVQMSFLLAGPSARSSAYLLDTLVRAALLLLAAALAMCAGMSLPGFSIGFFLVAWFLVEWGYFAFFEWIWSGQTIGKKAMGIRVVERHGHPLSAWSALVRNLIRAADSVGMYGPCFVSMILSGKMQRLGDLAAGTMVIHERPVRLPVEPVILDTIKPLELNDIGGFVPKERTLLLIDRLLSRRTNSRERIPHERGHALSRGLAMRLAEKMEYRGDWEQVKNYSMAFLARVYVTYLRRREEEDSPDKPAAAVDRPPRPAVRKGRTP